MDNSHSDPLSNQKGAVRNNLTCRRLEPFSVWVLGWAAFVTVGIDLTSRIATSEFEWPGILVTLAAIAASLPATWVVFYFYHRFHISRDPNLKQLKAELKELMIKVSGRPGTENDISEAEILSRFDTSCHDHLRHLIRERKKAVKQQ